MNRNRSAVVAAVALMAAIPAGGNEVDAYIAAQMKAKQIPGLSLAVVRNGTIIKARGYGRADLEQDVPAGVETVYEIGSITKPFTASAIMMLVEESKVGLDEPIGTYLADLPDVWRPVTVRHLLSHTSGIKSYTSVADFVTLTRADHDPPAILKLVSGRPLEFRPGEKFSYNNTGYYLLGLIVEKAGGRRYPAFLAERIFKPLHMDATRASDPRAIIPRRARGYARTLGAFVNRDPITPGSAFSAGCLISNVVDLAKWDAALGRGELLRPASYRQMYAPTRLNDETTHPYGFGWSVGSRLRHEYRAHDGGTAGFSTSITRYIDDHLTVIVLTNLSGLEAGRIARGVAKSYLPDLDLDRLTPGPDPDPASTAALKQATTELLAVKVDESRYTPEFARHLAKARTRLTLVQIALHGKMKEFTHLSTKGEGDRVRHYKLGVGRATYLLTFRLTDAGKIAGITAEQGD